MCLEGNKALSCASLEAFIFSSAPGTLTSISTHQHILPVITIIESISTNQHTLPECNQLQVYDSISYFSTDDPGSSKALTASVIVLSIIILLLLLLLIGLLILFYLKPKISCTQIYKNKHIDQQVYLNTYNFLLSMYCNWFGFLSRPQNYDYGLRPQVPLTKENSVVVDGPPGNGWEIPSQYIVREHELGEGSFGKVAKGYIRGPIPGTYTMKDQFHVSVAIKFLKGIIIIITPAPVMNN